MWGEGWGEEEREREKERSSVFAIGNEKFKKSIIKNDMQTGKPLAG